MITLSSHFQIEKESGVAKLGQEPLWSSFRYPMVRVNIKKEWDGSEKLDVGKLPATSEQMMWRIFQSTGYLSGYVCFAFFTKSFLDVTEERGVSTSDIFLYVQHTGFPLFDNEPVIFCSSKMIIRRKYFFTFSPSG